MSIEVGSHVRVISPPGMVVDQIVDEWAICTWYEVGGGWQKTIVNVAALELVPPRVPAGCSVLATCEEGEPVIGQGSPPGETYLDAFSHSRKVAATSVGAMKERPLEPTIGTRHGDLLLPGDVMRLDRGDREKVRKSIADYRAERATLDDWQFESICRYECALDAADRRDAEKAAEPSTRQRAQNGSMTINKANREDRWHPVSWGDEPWVGSPK